ncbi:hypothetical protein [Acinetobacter lwoffii]|uniref:hypothetical protein n=1 Tax=Acinetobacter lwoffii TaxID=28090 RepID=UPI001C08ED50|nr:hypothetical protein [Acinetobacter lwoffii]
MAVPEQTPYIEHTGNGITTSFALGFQCETKDHLIVLIDDIEPPIATWSLTGGNVIFTTAPAAGKKITLQRNTPFSRTTDYQSYNNSFRPPAVNKDFDWIWWKLQELGVADWILGNRISALKNYVDRKDDELKAYLMEEIRKQGVALDQLDEYYNYLMERLAQIAVDKGWDASFVVDGDKTQKELNDLAKVGKSNSWIEGKVYKIGDKVQLKNSLEVISTIADNTNDPNENIIGWRYAQAISIKTFGALPESDAEATTTSIQLAINYVKKYFGVGAVIFPATGGDEYYYNANELFVPEGITLIGENGKVNGLYGATIYLRSAKEDYDTTQYFNSNITFQDLRCKKTHLKLYSKTSKSWSAGFMIIKLNNMTLDGTNRDGEGSIGGDCLQIRNATFDVHLHQTYINNYQGAAYSCVSDNADTTIPYFATGVFSTINQSKFYNCGYGIYAKGAAADSTDIHATNLLLDHNTVGVYADGTRLDGMGELSIQITSGRTELNSSYAFQILNGAQFNYDGWCMSSGYTVNKIYVDDASHLDLSGRYNQVQFEGESLKSKINFKYGTINTLARYSNCINNLPAPRVAGNGSYAASIQRKVAMQLSFSGGNTTVQVVGKGLVSGRWYNGLSYGVISSDTASGAIALGGSATVGSGYEAYTISISPNSDLALSFNDDTIVWLGNMSIISNNTGIDCRLSGTVSASGGNLSMLLANPTTGSNINFSTLNGSVIIQFEYWCI